ncbi:hypothetical protein CQW23_26664 [Capsicum baccatum]|uniref:Uncharacterized protein n=1 Tax=Capsicum baccatum TaxID=33114 RepID=A0A2G2VPF8_CAPBA|nr:hypothetical protein CQW23_26664 [Capsicum baccatum]
MLPLLGPLTNYTADAIKGPSAVNPEKFPLVAAVGIGGGSGMYIPPVNNVKYDLEELMSEQLVESSQLQAVALRMVLQAPWELLFEVFLSIPCNYHPFLAVVVVELIPVGILAAWMTISLIWKTYSEITYLVLANKNLSFIVVHHNLSLVSLERPLLCDSFEASTSGLFLQGFRYLNIGERKVLPQSGEKGILELQRNTAEACPACFVNYHVSFV